MMDKDFMTLLSQLIDVKTKVTALTQEAIDKVWPIESREKLAEAMGQFADRIQTLQRQADSMTEEEANSFLIGWLKRISRKEYEEHFEDWTEGPEPTKQGFRVYVTQVATHSIEVAIICGQHKGLDARLKENIEAYVSEVYPETEADEPKPLPKMPKKPQKYTTATNLLMKDLTGKAVVNAGPYDLPVMPDKGITTYVAIAYEKEKDPFGLTPKQVTIMDAVNAVYEQGQADGLEGPIPMTPVSIFKAMPGGSTRPTAAKLKEIEKTVSMFRDMPAEINATPELRAAGKIGKGEKFHLKTNMILARELRYTRKNGTETIGWQVFEPPVASAYAKKQGQVVSVPARVVQIQELDEKTKEPNGALISINDNRRELLAHMVRRVGVMLNAYRKAKNAERLKRNRDMGRTWHAIMTGPKEAGGLSVSDIIRYDSAFAVAGIETKRKNTVMELKDFCIAVLKYWKAIGYIHGFEELKTGKQRNGLKILFE